MEVRHSIIAGNTINATVDDLFTGSILSFFSHGYNVIGRIDFSQILVPIPDWWYLSRKHWPSGRDLHGIEISDVLSLNNIKNHNFIKSAGTDKGQNVVLWYPPTGYALDQIPSTNYSVNYVIAEYNLVQDKTDDFLNRILEKLRYDYADILGNDFGKNFGDMTGITWHGPKNTWPTNPENSAWIKFWRDLDNEIGDRLGPVKLGDDFWAPFPFGLWGERSCFVKHSSLHGFRLPTQTSWQHPGHPAKRVISERSSNKPCDKRIKFYTCYISLFATFSPYYA